MKSVGSWTERLNTPRTWIITAVFVVGIYFSLTWFFFGSSHPCGILEAKQKPYVVQRYVAATARAESRAWERYWQLHNVYSNMLDKGQTPSVYTEEALEVFLKQYDKTLQDVSDAPKEAVHVLHERIWNHYTPARCFREAVVYWSSADPLL